MKYEVYLLDADGTLFDFDMAEADAFKHVFISAGLHYSEGALRRYRDII